MSLETAKAEEHSTNSHSNWYRCWLMGLLLTSYFSNRKEAFSAQSYVLRRAVALNNNKELEKIQYAICDPDSKKDS